ncbi:glutathione S-transferase [Aliidiomarina halalkaliphila]|uniref:Glutathione S-transferase n=1 Tax=Aliidiomarina halalkaliphila TaxID=2593535 RepID=A0A552X6B7_9GAMM|nr:MAPEG family protein [Aliidiomarina halalkaliphila]TRW50113.1 glutathione S-transferase [Aliidiomarina halalkaliphila]
MLLPITSLFAALLTLLFIVLSIRIIRLRWSNRVGIGWGESKDLEVAVRIHGNFVEYVPLALILLALIEFTGANAMLLYGLGGLLFVARINHAIGLTRSVGPTIYRTIGVLGTFAMLLVSAAYLIGYVLGTQL